MIDAPVLRDVGDKRKMASARLAIRGDREKMLIFRSLVNQSVTKCKNQLLAFLIKCESKQARNRYSDPFTNLGLN